MGKLSIDIIGCGDFGGEIGEWLNTLSQYEILSVCDLSEERAQALASKLGVPAFTSFEECLAKSPAMAVALFTPNNLHCPMALKAAQWESTSFVKNPWPSRWKNAMT